MPNKWGRKSIRSSGPQASRPRESCADFKKAGGPPFLDMRPSDVGRRLSLHVQSPPPISLMRFWKFNFARGMRQFIRPQTPRTVLSFGSFFLGIDFGQSHALTGSARTHSAWWYNMTANWRKQKAPRSSAPAHSSHGRGMCSEPNRMSSCSGRVRKFWFSRAMTHWRQKALVIFRSLSSAIRNRNVDRTRRIVLRSGELSSKGAERFFRRDSITAAGCKIHASAS